MSRKGKWVDISSPEEPASDVARRVLADRLNLVCRYLQRASEGATTDTENVHQLRVSTRRAVAAIKNFQQFLPRRKTRWVLKRLKQVRRAAGAARDLDVMLARFCASADSANDRATDRVIAYLKQLREEAQGSIDQIGGYLRRKHFRRRIRRLASKARDREDFSEQPLTMQRAGRTAIEALVQAFHRAGDADLSEHARLHAFRIEAKQLRYAMEIFAAAFAPEFRSELCPLIATLQERLGEVNDHATAQEQLAAWSHNVTLDEEFRSALEALRQVEDTLLHDSTKEFLLWWTESRKKHFREQFDRVLNCAEPGPRSHAQTLLLQRRAE